MPKFMKGSLDRCRVRRVAAPDGNTKNQRSGGVGDPFQAAAMCTEKSTWADEDRICHLPYDIVLKINVVGVLKSGAQERTRDNLA